MNCKKLPKKWVFFPLLMLLMSFAGSVWGQTVTVPTVVTNEVNNVTAITARGNGNVTDDGGAPVTERGICWGTNQNPNISGTHLASESGTGYFVVEMTDLEPNTTYYVRAYATNSAGTAYGIQRNFTTPVIEAPTVATLDVIHIRNNSAVGVARVTSQGNDPTTERGVCWTTSSSNPPTISDSHATNGMGQGNYSVDMSGLQPNTTYYMRAYAQNSAGIAYGQVLTFFTQVHMQNGTIEVDDAGFDFTDSEADDGWYNHNEDYTLVFIPESTSNGVKIEFESLLINNDYLYFYDGDISDNNLIGVFTCNEYHAYQHGGDGQISVFGLNGNIFTVTSHSYMTVRFVSDYHWKDAGWVAHVSQVPFTPQPPAVAKLACTDDTFELLPTSKGKFSTTLKYAIAYGGENPGEPNTVYNTPININGSYPVKIRVITEVVETEGADPISSSSRLFTFGDESLVGHPEAPTITPPASSTSSVTLSVVRPGDLNDTWKILYTLDGTDPSTSATAQAITTTTEDPNEPHDVTTSGTVALYDFCEVIAVVQGTTCPNVYSNTTSYIYDDTHTIYLVPPTISFAGNGSTASTTIIPPTEGCIIYYTVNDGPTQIYSSPAIDGNPAIAPTPFMVNANDRVKAWVDKPGSNYVESGPAVSTYLPNIITPGIGTGVYGRVVYLDDREPHGWSYYSDTLQPVYSLNPVDVKITYFGDGTRNMTNASENQDAPTSFSANATGTMVNIDAPENQFVYYKTLESGEFDATDEPNGYVHLVPDYEGESGKYPYTTIPNPFQVRPVFNPRGSMGDYDPNTPQSGNNRDIFTETFESFNVGSIPDEWCNNCVQISGQNTTYPPTVSTGVNIGYNNNFNMGQNNKFLLFRANGSDGFGNAIIVLPAYPEVTSIGFDYRCNGNQYNNIRVGCYYENQDYSDSYEVAVYDDDDDIHRVLVNTTNNPRLFEAVNNGGRIVLRLFNYAGNDMYAGIDNLTINYVANTHPSNPVFDYPNGYTFEGTSATITITDETSNVTIYYTIDGSTPGPNNENSNTVANGGTVTIDPNHPTLKAIAIRNNNSDLASAVTTATYNFNLSTPVFNPDGGVITGTGSQVVTISNPDVGTTTVYYTLDGSIPTTDSPHFDGASITVTVDVDHPILKAIAIHNETPDLTSALHTAIYTFRPNNPVITPDGGLIFAEQTVSISLSGEGTIYYTTDGSVPDPDHVGGSYPTQIYQGPFTVNSTTTVRAIAHASYGNSDVVEAVYVLGQTVTNNNQYRGFYKWRIERISGGKIYDANGNEKKAYASGLSFNDYTVNAEERLVFEPDSEYGMEVDYVALWAQAYIGSLSQDWWGNLIVNDLNNGVSYERNFLIGETQIRAITYPATYSSYYPNGAPSNNASSNVTLIPNNNNNDRYFCSADMKFENMNFSYNQRIVGNNHNLCFGRGINTVNVPYGLEGINSTENNGIGPLDYTIRIESGRFDMLSFLLDNITYANGQKHRINGRYLVKGIMGSDYDRAKKDNNKLLICCNTGVAGRLFLSYGTNGSDPVNKDKETFNLVVKSGSYQNQYWENGGDGQYDQSFYVGENASSGYPGVRFITVEGGEFGSMNGGRGSGSNFQYADPEIVTSSIRIKGGTFHGSVFGAAADNMSIGSRRIVVTGHQDENQQPTTLIEGWIAGGCNGNGQGDDNSDGSVDGNSFIYVGGYASIGGDSPVTVNGTQGGQVFGAGRGMYGRRSCINNSYVVIADSSYVTNNVYGGGHHGYITEQSNVYIIGGVVGRDVYGGAFEHDTTYHNVNGVDYYGYIIPATRVYVRAGEVRGCVYGGSNNVGFIGDNNAEIEMTGGTVGTLGSYENGNVFGGGNGLTTKILSNTIVTVNGGLVVNNVYGGGNEGKVEGKATVNIVKDEEDDEGAQIGDIHSDVNPTKGNVYGGGKGKKTKGTLTYVNETEVNIIGSYIMGSVFGGGENGIVKTNTEVNVEGGQVGGHPGEITGGEHLDCDNPYHGSVYGGGSGLNYEGGEMVEGSIEDGWVKGNATVNIISGAHVMRNVYGGSNVASVGLYQGTDTYGFYNQVPNTGLATVNISGGIIGTTGHNDTIRDANTNEIVDVVSNGMVFGSSHGKAVIGKKEYAHVNETHVIISAGADVRGSVFGGGDDGFVLGNTLVEIIDGTIGASLTGEESEIDPYGSSSVIYTGNVYGGGRGIDRHNDTISTIAGFVKGNTEVRMTGGLVRHNVYGGGSLACVGFKDKPNTGKATVHINGGQVGSTGRNNGRVFGSGRGMPATPGDDELMKYANLAFTNNTYVTIDGVAKVMGAVFGGGENGHVFHKTKVTIDGDASIGSEYMHPFTGDVYGGGRGVDRYGTGLYDFSRTAGKVYEETEVNINDGTIYHAVYGGGTMASVGQIETSDGTPTGTPYYYSYDDETLADAETGYLKLKPTTDVPNNGRTVVNIRGGVIGTDGSNGDGNGNVFGSAKGWAGSQFKHLAYTGNTDVNIIGGHIMGSAFGGGENGHVLGSTDIEVSGGEIGLTGSHSTLMGNVFGGGCGTDKDLNGKYSLTAGWVKFNTNTLVRGGSVYRNVYGGGNLASVGYAENHNAEFSGRANVLIKENAVIGIDGNENGHVFGSGYGRAATESGADTIYAQMAFVKNTFVTIQDDAEVKGSVFGSGENGHVRQNTHVFVEGGEIGTDGTTGYEGNVYGGGRGKDLNANNDYSRTSGRTYGNTFVDISGGKVNGSVFGGGRMATVGTYPAQDTIPADPDFNNGGETGRATVYIHGGVTIGNENTALRGGNVYGGAKGLVGTKYAQLAYLKNTEVIIKETATINGSVFGGGENGHVSENTKVAIYNGTIGFAGGNEYKGNVFGGGRGIDRDADGNQTVTAGIVKGSTRVFFEGGTAYGSVFGGGNASLVSLEKVVNINGGDVMKNVFGGCKQVVGDTKVRLHPGTKTVNMRGGHVYGSVFGCSNNSIDGNFEEGHEKDWTAFVNISGGTIDGNVHGLGYAGEVIGSSEVNVGVNAIAEKVNGEWSDLNKRNVDNIYFDDRAYLPTVLTTGLFDVTGTSAEVDGYVSAIANSNVTERGICWGTSPEPTTMVPATTEGDGRGYYTLDLTGLTPGTTYYVRAYAINGKGTTYGAEISFTTDAEEPNYATAEIDRDEHEGKIAIENAVSIGNSVYAGSSYFGTQGNNVNDWTHYDATGYTNIYIDGTSYNTLENSGNYMNIGGGVFGSGTHCEAGLSGHNVLMREYGHRNTKNTDHGAEFTSGTRTLTTIQRCQNLLLDNVNINITGFNDINTTYNTNKLYSVVKVDDTLYMANASAIAIGDGQPAYMDSIFCVRSVHLNVTNRTIYDELDALEDDELTNIENDSIKQNYGKIPSWEWIAVKPITGGANTAQNARLYYRTSDSNTQNPLDYEQENVILFKDFSQLWVRYHRDTTITMYGELQGFFRMDSDFEPYGTESFAFARPKITGANNNNILSGDTESPYPYLYAKDNLEDGGFLSYKVDDLGGDYPNGYNFFTEPGLIGGWNYPADGDDGGIEFTNTKQYPYINVYPITRDNRHFYRMWVIPRRNGAAWYVDGRGVGAETGGWGKDLNHQDGWGHFPDKPKLTVSFNAGADDAHNGIIYDRTRYVPSPTGEGYEYGPYRVFDPSKDVIYVVGPVSALKEEAGGEININRDWEGEYTLYNLPDSLYPLHNYKLKLFRYPGGHKMSNDTIDLSGTTTLLTQQILDTITFEDYNGLPDSVVTGPGANYDAMIVVDSISDKQGNITLNNVLVDGLYGHTQIDDGFHQIPTSFNQDAVHKPLVVMGSGTTLTLKSVAEPDDPTQEGTELQRGYNNTKAAYYYDPDYDDDESDAPAIVDTTRHGGAVYVHRYATMNAEGKVTVKENLQNLDQIVYDEDGEENGTTPVKIESNVYLPTFKKHTYITGPLDQISRIGITSPIRNAEPHFTQNTMSPIAEATNANIAYNAWNNENYYDDLARFFYRGYQDDFKTTYYEQDAANYSPALADAGDDETIEKTLYFGWTWNNVVTRKPLDFSYDSIDSPEDLAWLISVVNGLNGRVANDLSSINVIEEKTDIDLVQYVWLPVGDQIAGVKPFGSKFDGRGHIITNLSMAYFGMGDGRYNRVNYGMFGAVDGGVVDRTFVLSGYIEPVSDLNHKGDANIGTLVGMLGTEGASKPKSMVSNSEGGADIVCAVRDDAFNVGSVIGYMVEGELHSSMGMSDIKAEKSYKEGGYIGGLVGRAEPNIDGKVANINNSFSNPKLMFGVDSDVKAGGLVGYNVATIKNCYSRLQEKDSTDNHVTNAKFKLLAFETKMPIILGHSFQSPVFEQAGFDAGFASLLTNCYHYTDPMSADRYRYIYNDNKLQVKDGDSWKDIAEDETCLLFNNLNQWVEDNNGTTGHKYSLWVRPTITGINDDFPILHLCDWTESKQGHGDFRSMATWHGGPKLQYAGPVRDYNELNSMVDRMTTKDYMYVYGDVTDVMTARVDSANLYRPAKLSVYEHAAILHPGTLAGHPETYVGVTFDNSCAHAYSTPGLNHIEDSLFLPRDWHMFSSPLSNAPLGFNYEVNDVNTNLSEYYTGGDRGTYFNNPWPYIDGVANSTYGEFTWLNNSGSDVNRYWMKGWVNSQSQNCPEPEFDEDKWVDGYFPSRVADQSEFGDGCIETEDEYGRFPYGMDMFCWYEPEPHWINFKRNGPNHWHSDESNPWAPHNQHIHKHLPYTEKNEDDSADISNQNEDYLKIGKGYMFAIAKKTYLQSHGNLNAEEKYRAVTRRGKDFPGWNLVGNPYHAYLDFGAFVSRNESIEPYYVIYDADGYTGGPKSAYLYYPKSGSEGGEYADPYLHPHQGFFIMTHNGNVPLYFDENMSVTRSDTIDIAFRNRSYNYPLVNLYLSSERGCSDVTVIEFHRPSWGGAKKQKGLRQGNGLFYAYHENEPYAALFAKEGTDKVPLKFEAKEDDVFTMRWNTANGYFSSLYLIDNLTGARYDMLANDSYVFEGHKDDYYSRFYITFDCLDVEEYEEDEVEKTFAFFDGSQWVVTGEGTLELIDLQGRILWQERVSGGQSRVSIPDVAKSLYLLRLVNSSEGTKVQKIVID